ncbi:hypothetical protein L3Q67_32255 [Saccharothrix sp. AJ9571]|nr:hypothetical protein L3Q67_32255 [Saccharothrix sp. AJ9571]
MGRVLLGMARTADALNELTWIVIRQVGVVGDITVGDCFELTKALQEHHLRGSAGRPLFYAMLKQASVLPAAAPERLRLLRLDGRRSVEQIVDAYGIECLPVRDLLVECLTERSPELDHTSLRSVARNLCRLFWRDLEIHHPGIDSLRLVPEVAQAWRERPGPEDALGGAVPDQGVGGDPEEGPGARQSPDGSADQDPASVAAGVAAGRRAAPQGRRRTHHHRRGHSLREPVHRGRSGVAALPPG